MKNDNLQTIESYSEKLSALILKRLTRGKDMEHINYLKCKLGLEVFLINFSKMAVIYLLATLLKITIPVLIYHVAFFMIRTFAYGAHTKTSLECTLLSSIILVGNPYLITYGLILPTKILILLALINCLVLFIYAPADTKKNPITNKSRRRKLKRKAILFNLIQLLIVIIHPSLYISNLIIGGSTMACIMLLPLTFNLLYRRKLYV